MYSGATVNYVGDERVEISGRCVVTGRRFAVTVAHEALTRYLAGALAQDAFPELPKKDRELSFLKPDQKGGLNYSANRKRRKKLWIRHRTRNNRTADLKR